MKITEFRVMLYPKDFDMTRAFYVNILKFPIINEWNRSSNDRGTMFDVCGTTVELLSTDGEPQPITGISLSLEVPNVNELWLEFQDEDFITQGLRHNLWGDSSFQISDPDGLEIIFFTKD